MLFILGAGCNFFIGYFDERMKVVNDRKKIADRYMNSYKFYMDCIAAFPIETFGFMAGLGLDSRIISFLRGNRLLRIHYLDTTVKHETKQLIVVAIAKLMLGMYLVTHWFGCLFYAVAELDADSDTDTWLKNFPDATVATRYVNSLYFSLVTMVTIGFGDIVPVSNAEKIYTCFMIIIGALVYSVVFGKVNLLIARLDAYHTRYRSQMDKVNEFIGLHNVPRKLSERLRDYQKEMWNLQKGFDMGMCFFFSICVVVHSSSSIDTVM